MGLLGHLLFSTAWAPFNFNFKPRVKSRTVERNVFHPKFDEIRSINDEITKYLGSDAVTDKDQKLQNAEDFCQKKAEALDDLTSEETVPYEKFMFARLTNPNEPVEHIVVSHGLNCLLGTTTKTGVDGLSILFKSLCDAFHEGERQNKNVIIQLFPIVKLFGTYAYVKFGMFGVVELTLAHLVGPVLSFLQQKQFPLHFHSFGYSMGGIHATLLGMNLNHLKQAGEGEVVVMPMLTEENYANLERCATKLHTALKADRTKYFDEYRTEFALCVTQLEKYSGKSLALQPDRILPKFQLPTKFEVKTVVTLASPMHGIKSSATGWALSMIKSFAGTLMREEIEGGDKSFINRFFDSNTAKEAMNGVAASHIYGNPDHVIGKQMQHRCQNYKDEWSWETSRWGQQIALCQSARDKQVTNLFRNKELPVFHVTIVCGEYRIGEQEWCARRLRRFLEQTVLVNITSNSFCPCLFVVLFVLFF